uniref:hypothetical protein n=1 Tax=uncultured Dysgonomonas sp. TaxID=206096 RepID=UPI002636E21B|nr:hypothetical protein [uncultured Dysgonomonas sp.]
MVLYSVNRRITAFIYNGNQVKMITQRDDTTELESYYIRYTVNLIGNAIAGNVNSWG